MSWLADDSGSAVVTIVLLPLLIVVFASTFELGSLRVVAARAQTAADLAALVAVNDQDDVELRRTGRLRPAADAEVIARAVLAENLGSISGILVATPAEIAARATVAITAAPSAVRVVATIPVRTPFFGAILSRSSVDLLIRATASAR